MTGDGPDRRDRDDTPVPPRLGDEAVTLDLTVPLVDRKVLDEAAPARGASKARLVVLQGARVGRRHPLDHASTIGRGPSCTVPLDDPMASRKHALLRRTTDAGWELMDLGSRNGTELNGRRVVVAPIQFGDRIQIGGTVLLFSHVDPIEEQITHRQKLEAIGRLGAGIAHDINNVLGGVVMNADYLAQLDGARTLGDPDVRASLDDLRVAAALGTELTRRILGLVGRGASDQQQVDLSALVLDAAALARRTFERSIRVEADVTPSVHVRGERGALEQLVMNLLIHARDALSDGGTVRVSLAPSAADEVDSALVAIASDHATIVVSDDGAGMDEATRARIFDPFFTTKATENGAGLGLSTVHEAVIAHGGTIECESALGRGSTFRVVLPALVAAPRPERHTPIALVRPQKVVPTSSTILVVDDEPLSRRSLCRLLERDGYRTLSAADGREALEVFRAEAERIDLVLLDLDMPELDGEAAYREMARSRPETPVLILTGYIEDQRRAALLAAGVRRVLLKPIAVEALRSAIVSTLGARRRTGPPPGDAPAR